MKIVGYDFTSAPENLRKALLYEREDVQKSALSLVHRTRSRYVLLVTCNRVEIYTSDDSNISHTMLSSALGLNYPMTRDYRYSIDGNEVIRHLFLLSTGVLSAYFGEEVILSQLNIAIETARRVGSVSGELNVLFQSAIAFAKRVHTEMKVRVFDQDIVSRCVSIVSGRRTLVIGSGELARSIARALVESGVETEQAIRDISKADFLVPHGVEVVPWDERMAAISACDAIVSASSAIGYTLPESALGIVKGKLLVDLASPSDFPSSFSALTMDDLGASTPLRDAVVKRVGKMADDEVSVYLREMEKRREFQSVEERAVDIASDSVRRLSSILPLEDEKGLAEKVYETIRKASINNMMRTRRY